MNPINRPKVKRSPWAIKPRDVSRRKFLREEREKGSRIEVTGEMAKAFQIIYGNASLDEKRQFLKDHPPFTAQAILAFQAMHPSLRKPNRDEVIRNLKKPGNKINPQLAPQLASYVAGEYVERNAAQIAKALEKSLRNYFSKRGFPAKTEIDKKALSRAISEYIDFNSIDLAKKLDMAKLEQSFLKFRREMKREEFAEHQEMNHIFRKAFGRARLTAKQRKTALKSIRREYHRFRASLDESTKAALNHGDTSKLSETREVIENKFVERIKQDLLSSFGVIAPKQKPKMIVGLNGIDLNGNNMTNHQLKKAGDRRARMAAHEKAELHNTRRKERELKDIELAAKNNGVKFDSPSFILQEMRTANPKGAQILSDLRKQGFLSDASLRKLYSRGFLAQRLFVVTLNETNFLKEFGFDTVNSLANGLSSIGYQGKLIDGIVKSFHTPDSPHTGQRIFNFLVKSGIIEASHGGGKVAYLKRLHQSSKVTA
jgi:hypothetical protein